MSIFQEIILYYLKEIRIESLDELVFLGTANLNCIKQYWNSAEDLLNDKMKAIRESDEIPSDSTVADTRAEYSRLAADRDKADLFVGYLIDAIHRAEHKPLFAAFRPNDWFNIGDRVYVFITDTREDAIVNNAFVPGYVVYGLGHHDGFVSVRTDEKIHDGQYRDGHGAFRNVVEQTILHEWEYYYLKNNPDYRNIWLKANSSNESERIALALAE